MKKLKLWILILIILPYIYSCGSNKVSELPYYDKPDFTPLWVSDREAKNLHEISDFSFTDQDGKQVTKETFKGKIYLANFFFTTCPGICPTMTKNLLKLQNTFVNDIDVKIISHSVMPWSDSVKNLKEYEKTFNIKNGMWYLVTGKTSEIYELARRSYYAEEKAGYNSDSTEFLHTEHILLVDKNGHLRGIYNGTLALDAERMIEDIKILKKES
ncbi:MAG: SCO family protein [Ignavibacteria bacterium]